MIRLKNNLQKIKKTHLQIGGVLLLILLAVLLLMFNRTTSMEAMSALVADVYFDGEYRIGDGEWSKITKGEHISSTMGDVTLRGNFHMNAPNGEYVGIYRGELPIAFYTNHINLTFYEVGVEPIVLDMENPMYGSSVCGKGWTAHTLMSESEDPIEILIHNPHRFGNENAVDELLSSTAFWTGAEFEKEAMSNGESQRNAGLMLIMVAVVFLGIALFSTLIHTKGSKTIWLLGLLVFFAGTFFVYGSHSISLWNNSTVSNTTMLGVSMMLYMLFFSMTFLQLLKATKKVGIFIVGIMWAVDALIFVLPIVTDVLFYDTWVWWIDAQLLANTVLSICLVVELAVTKSKLSVLSIGAFLPILAFDADVLGTWFGILNGGVLSKSVFIVLFVVAVIMVLKLIPHNINAAAKAKELEMEKIVLNAQLSETRISTMMSQIRPHFIYNTLGTIEQLCKMEPMKAKELAHNFAKYLRGNFGELDNPKPIPMSQEMEHVHYYVSIEKVRFPDMTFTFDLKTQEFCIPALTVQPIVENAIKHGLMRLPQGGTVYVTSYETETDYCISVVDDGVGFDVNAMPNDRKHLGLRNIRERLKVMVNGRLEIESTVGVGTKVEILIPKGEDR